MSEQFTNPFPGLRSFEPHEEHLFFGREKQIDDVLECLRLNRFLMVIGSSGSGKSSLVRSGMIPALFSGYMAGVSSSWRISVMRPGDDPIGGLARCLWEPVTFGLDDDLDDLFGGDDDYDDEYEDDDSSMSEEELRMARAMVGATLKRSARGLIEAVGQLNLDSDQQVLIVVDQFEELFRFKRESRDSKGGDPATAFMKLLLNAAEQRDLPLYVVLTMRSDFLENCTEIDGLTEAINGGHYLVPRMNREQRRAAVSGPVAVSGAEMSPRLIMRLLNDVGDNLDQLPILQHALMRTWEYWHGNHAENEPLDLRHYEAIGTMGEALSLHAEEAYRELGSQEERRCAQKVFSALTEKGEDGRGIRRPTTIARICDETGVAFETVVKVVECFRRSGRSFLFPPVGMPLGPDTTIDISHESLMRVWTRLEDWVEDEARSARLYRGLATAAARYQEGVAGLYHDPELQMALRWKEEMHPNAAWAERYDPSFERAMVFLENSRQDRDRSIAIKEQQQKRSLRRTRFFSAVLAIFALLSLGLVALSLSQSRQARKEKLVAEEKSAEAEQARKIAVEAQKTVRAQHEEAVSLREKAERKSLEAEDARLEAERSLEVAREARKRMEEEMARVARAKLETEEALAAARQAEAEAEDARREAVRESKNAQEAEQVAVTNLERSRNLMLLDFARKLAGRVPGLQQRDPQLAALAAMESWLLTREYSPSDWAIIPGLHESLRVAAKGMSAPLETFWQTGDSVRTMAISQQYGMLVAGTDMGSLWTLDINQPGAAPQKMQTIQGSIRALALHPTQPIIAVGALSGEIRVLSLNGASVPPEYDSSELREGSITALAYSPNGSMLAAAGADGYLIVRMINDEKTRAGMINGFGKQIRALAFHPDGSGLFVGGSSGAVYLEEIAYNGEHQRPVLFDGDITAVAFAPDGSRMAAGTAEGEIRIWETARREQPPLVKNGHVSSINSLVFASDGKTLVSGSADQSIKLWHITDDQMAPVSLPDHQGWVWSVVLDNKGHIFSGGADERIHRWAVASEMLARAACDRIERGMSRQEWDELVSEAVTGDSMEILKGILRWRDPCQEAEHPEHGESND